MLKKIFTCKPFTVRFYTLWYIWNRVHCLITNEGAKRRILDNITVILKYFWQMTITWSLDINKHDSSILILLKKKFIFCKHFGIVLTEGIGTVQFCTEVFVMPKYFMTKLSNIWIIFIHVSTLCHHFISTIFQNYYDMVKIFFFLHLHWGGVVHCVYGLWASGRCTLCTASE